MPNKLHHYFVISVVLAVTTPLSNLMVLIIFCINKKLMNKQTVYRILLGILDFFTGIVVFPLLIISKFPRLNTIEAIQYKNDFYIDAIGFFTMLSLHVSIFTLVAAVIDSSKVVYRPLSYNVKSFISLGLNICVVLWIISMILAALLLSILDNSLPYSIERGILSISIIHFSAT